jgi:hypothetical protein
MELPTRFTSLSTEDGELMVGAHQL